MQNKQENNAATELPVELTTFVGRERELVREVNALHDRLPDSPIYSRWRWRNLEQCGNDCRGDLEISRGRLRLRRRRRKRPLESTSDDKEHRQVGNQPAY